MKITIYDVAKKAGVSISTASKALNDRRDVGDATKEKIREIAREMNYEPSHFARALAMRKTENIGVITVRYYGAPMLTNPFYSRIIEGIEERLINNNLNLVTNVLTREQVERLEMPKMIKEKSADGVILLGYMPDEFVEIIASKGVPVVMVDNYYKDSGITSIITDDFNGAREAVSVLIKNGHKKIAYLSGPSRRRSFKLRGEGYQKALGDAGIEADPGLIVFNEQEDKTAGWMRKILEKGRPDAVFACNDVTAILAINMLREAGLSVPDDVSVMGFDNIELSQHFIPAISTVDINKEAMGMKAADLLLEQVKTKQVRADKIVFPVNLILRESLKPRL